ncbi:uncharacterized protein LOC110103789 isoform X1 [Dendrobium catenatum]|uniref:uncharacterized protein LOC110103789 isoform X1 n=1 Tax=Dendrobium catenatum TaxID=906689 RepID=UPI00109FAADB|nr:uncharacterized protein LOC110103789 isoform X1 [Dendrobium catenatum]XP_028554188.1 uncharacterized protein LOC110103789 isoform X1 [Dendrobium catenatum]
MLSKSFKSGKCKTSLKLGISRIKLLKNRRDIQVKQLRRELAQLLATGQEQTARIRVEHVIREEKTMSAYDLIEIYCELIVARMPIIESQKSCPIDLKEAISSVIFASPRCADIPELMDARKQFVAKYGKEFATSALELRPDCGVNRMIVEKLSAKTPDTETKTKILTAIAKEHDVKWDPKAFDEKLQKPKEDLLNGSSSFVGANKTSMEPLNIKLPPNVSQAESASKVYQSEIPSKPTSFDSSSHSNLRSTRLVPPPASNDSRESDWKAGVPEVRDSYRTEDIASFKHPTWKMEFNDAASAAQVAAESAERASIAARAAVELASRGNISRHNSNEPNVSSLHSNRDETPKRAVSSKLKDEHNESVNMEYDQVKGFEGMKEDMRKLPRDDLEEEISDHSRTSDEVMEYSSQMDNVRTFDSVRRSFSRMEMGNKKKNDEGAFVEKNAEVNYDRSASASFMVPTFDDEANWVPSIGMHESVNHDNLTHNTPEIDAGERLFRYDSKEYVPDDYPAAVFDEYDPESIDAKDNLFDSFHEKQNGQSPIFAPSNSSINSNIFSGSRHETHPVTVEKVPSSKFDYSDGLSSESDDDTSSSQQNRTAQNSNLFHEKSGLGGDDSHPREELQPLSSTKAKTPLEAEVKNHLEVSSSSVGVKDPEMPEELPSGGEFGLNFGRLTGGLRNRGYNHPPYTASSVFDSSVPSLEISGSAISNTTHIISPWEKPSTSSLMEDDPSNPIMPLASTNPKSDEAKGSLSEEYTKNKIFNTDKSFGVKHSVSNHEKSRGYRGGDPNPSAQVPQISEVLNEKIYSDKPRAKAYKELSSRMSKTDIDSDIDVEERDSKVNTEGQGNASSSTTFKLSRRTKDFTPKVRTNLPRSTKYSDMSNSETENFSSGQSSATEPLSQIVDKQNRNKPSDSGCGTKSQETAPQKASHVHPKLPDYETFAAHFQSLRANRR